MRRLFLRLIADYSIECKAYPAVLLGTICYSSVQLKG